MTRKIVYNINNKRYGIVVNIHAAFYQVYVHPNLTDRIKYGDGIYWFKESCLEVSEKEFLEVILRGQDG
jgi:hypothetical protein